MVLAGEATREVPLLPPKPFAFKTAKSNPSSSNFLFCNKNYSYVMFIN